MPIKITFNQISTIKLLFSYMYTQMPMQAFNDFGSNINYSGLYVLEDNMARHIDYRGFRNFLPEFNTNEPRYLLKL